MERDFYELYETAIKQSVPLTVSAGHNPVADWCIEVYDRSISRDKPVVAVQNCDRLCVFAAAFSKLSEHLLETRGGY